MIENNVFLCTDHMPTGLSICQWRGILFITLCLKVSMYNFKHLTTIEYFNISKQNKLEIYRNLNREADA